MERIVSGFKLRKNNETNKFDLVYFKKRIKHKKESFSTSNDNNFTIEKIKKLIENNRKTILEVAPPGEKYERMILGLKKKFGKKSPIPYKIAWKKYKEDRGKK